MHCIHHLPGRSPILFAVIALIAVSPRLDAHTVTVDGQNADWCGPGMLSATDDTVETIACSTDSELAWRDRANDMAGWSTGFPPLFFTVDPEVELSSFFVTHDCDNVYFLALLGPYAGTNSVPTMQVAVSTADSPTFGTWYDPDGNMPGLDRVEDAPEYVIVVDAGQQTVRVAASGIHGDAAWVPSAVSESVLEFSIPWTALGSAGGPLASMDLYVMVTHSAQDPNTGSMTGAPMTPPDDVITANFVNNSPPTSWQELSDNTVNYWLTYATTACINAPTRTPTPTPTATLSPNPTPSPTLTPTPDCSLLVLDRRIDNPDPDGGEAFGRVLALEDDLLGVGVPSESTQATGNGRVYVCDVPSGTVIRTIQNPSSGAFDFFGYSISLNLGRVLIGAYGVSNSQGRAYLVDASSGALIRNFADPAPASNQNFGEAVALAGNLAAIGVPNFDTPGIQGPGRVRIFDVTTGSVVRNIDNPLFGSVGFARTLVMDSNYLAVGASTLTINGSLVNVGRIYVYNVSTGALLHTIDEPTQQSQERFGTYMFIEGGELLAGSPNDDAGAMDSGSAFLYNLATGALIRTFSNPTPAVSDLFGSGLSMNGDRVLIGAPGDDDGGVNQGRAWMFDRSTGAVIQDFSQPAAPGEALGGGVALADFEVVAGLHGATVSGQSAAGSVFIYGQEMQFCPSPSPTVTPSPYASASPTASPSPTPVPLPGDKCSSALPISCGQVINANILFADMEYPDCLDKTGDRGKPAPNGFIPHGVWYTFTGTGDNYRAELCGSDFAGRIRIYSGTCGSVSCGPDSSEGCGDSNASVYWFADPGVQYFIHVSNDGPAGTGDYRLAVACDNLTPTPSPLPCCPGDANNSGSFVDANDFIAVQANFGADNGVGGLGDANCSGSFVDANDFIAVQANFGADCG